MGTKQCTQVEVFDQTYILISYFYYRNDMLLSFETRNGSIPKRKMLEYITNKIVNGSVPKLSNNYEYQRLTA